MGFKLNNVYDGTVVEAWSDLAYQSDTNLELRLVVETEDGKVNVKHKAYGDDTDITAAVMEHLGLEFPNGLEDPSDAVGKKVKVWVSEFDGTTYGKINAPNAPKKTRKPSKSKIAAAVARMKGVDEEIPF